MKLWIARDKDGELKLFSQLPNKYEDRFSQIIPLYCSIDRNEFPEITWENSPQQIELKLIEK